MPEVRTEIEVDNEVSPTSRVIDVYTQDRLGVLYTITRTLADARARHPPVEGRHRGRTASPTSSTCASTAGGKLDDHRVDEVRLALGEALGRLQVRAHED